MSYATVEAGLQTLLQALSRFEDADVTRGDWRVLDRGGAEKVVLYQGPFVADRPGDWSQVHYGWIVYAEVYERYADGGASERSLTAAVQDVLDTVGAYVTLDGLSGVRDATAERGEGLQYIYDEDGGGPFFVMERVVIRVEEDVLYDGSGEFA